MPDMTFSHMIALALLVILVVLVVDIAQSRINIRHLTRRSASVRELLEVYGQRLRAAEQTVRDVTESLRETVKQHGQHRGELDSLIHATRRLTVGHYEHMAALARLQRSSEADPDEWMRRHRLYQPADPLRLDKAAGLFRPAERRVEPTLTDPPPAAALLYEELITQGRHRIAEDYDRENGRGAFAAEMIRQGGHVMDDEEPEPVDLADVLEDPDNPAGAARLAEAELGGSGDGGAGPA